MDAEAESALARKLAKTFHLSVPDRRELPKSGLAFSAFVKAIRDVLAEKHRYPPDWRPDEPFDGIVIESQPDGFMLHERHEIGVSRFSPCKSRFARSLEEAVKVFLRKIFGDRIDGIPIDFRR